MFYQPVRQLCSDDQIRVLNTEGTAQMRHFILPNFSFLEECYITREQLLHELELLKKYRRMFNRTTVRPHGLRGNRLREVNLQLINLLVENAVLDRTMGGRVGHECERVTLFDRVYSVRMSNLAYRALVIEHKVLVNEADNVFLVRKSLLDSTKKAESRLADTLPIEQLMKFPRSYYKVLVSLHSERF
jgi:hypothetical protein